MKYPATLRLVVKAPGVAPQIQEHTVENEDDVLPLMQRLVGGYVEQVFCSREVAILCDEDGIAKGLPHNCGYLGTFLFVGLGWDAEEESEEWSGLSVAQAEAAVKWCDAHSGDRHPGESAWSITSGEEAAKVRKQIDDMRRGQDAEWDSLEGR